MATESFEVLAEAREDIGKGASRRLRRTGRIPAILYGGHKDPTSITVSHSEMLKHLQHESFYSHILTVKLGDESEKVVLKDLHRHPSRPEILHADFQRISADEKITMQIPLHFINEDNCIGVKQEGGAISHHLTDIEVRCLPKDLPEYIEIDLANVHAGEIVHISNITCPEGVELTAVIHGGAEEHPVVSVNKHGASDHLEEEEGEAASEGESE